MKRLIKILKWSYFKFNIKNNMKYRKKFTPQEAKDTIDKINNLINIEEEFLMTYKEGTCAIIDCVIKTENDTIDKHFKKIELLQEKKEYVKQFLNNKNKG